MLWAQSEPSLAIAEMPQSSESSVSCLTVLGCSVLSCATEGMHLGTLPQTCTLTLCVLSFFLSVKHGKHLSNATSATHEHLEGPATNDLKEFVLEMQKIITDLRKQVRVA